MADSIQAHITTEGPAPLAEDDTAWTVNEIRRRISESSSDEAIRAKEKRRHVSQRVREARERLTSTTGTRPAFDFELARLYAQNRLSAALPLLAFELVVATCILIWLPALSSIVWTVSVLCSHALIVVYARRFLKLSLSTAPMKPWFRRFTLAEFAHATCFAMIVPPLGLVESESARVFLIFAMLLAVAVRTMLSASVPVTVYAGSLPITAMLAAFFLTTGGNAALAIALVAPLAQVFFILLGQRLFRATLMTLEYRAEKDALIAELEQAKANSDDARRRAEAANVAKSRFLATMSHELRTPLNAILGFSEVLKSEVFGQHSNQTYKEYAGDIHSSGEHLLNLINELLDLSRIEAGRYELNEEAISLSDAVDDCCHLLKLRAKNRGIVIRTNLAGALPPLWADERAVRQVTLNLLSNAIKFTPQGGSVEVTVEATAEGGQSMIVRDTGPGIPADEIPVVLSSFGQGSLAIKTAEQGAGLGLPIVKGLVDLHGGTFELTSRLRQGTTVHVGFPASRVMSALPPIVPEAAQRMRRAS